MFCHRCGAQLSPQGDFCHSCGAAKAGGAARHAEPQAAPPPAEPRPATVPPGPAADIAPPAFARPPAPAQAPGPARAADGRLRGKTAVITGGASGIGAATARLFVAEGARVMIADVQDAKGEELAASLGGGAIHQHTDVTREEDVRAAVQRAVDAFGRLDCMFNNAGLAGPSSPIDELSMADYDFVMSVLLRGPVAGMKHAAAVMKRQGGGAIINTSSVAGLRAGYGSHVYTAAKAAVIHVTRSVAMELGESGVRVNCICPGGIATPIFKPILGDVDDETAVATMKPYLAGSQPIKRAGLPEDIANAALWLASDEASFVTGHALVVDGGMTGGRQWSEITQHLTRSQERGG